MPLWDYTKRTKRWRQLRCAAYLTLDVETVGKYAAMKI